MSSDSSSSTPPKINLLERFPHLRPVARAPVLTTVNGIGFGIYGHRDEDAETGAYIKTHCFCLVFIPVLAAGAYRVVDSREGGWYFLGREPLSNFAKLWNAFVVCLLLAGAGGAVWNAHVSSPEYLAQRDLRRAQAQLQGGDALPAAGSFEKLLTGPASAPARTGLQTALEQCWRSDSPRTNQGAVRLLARLGSGINRPTPLVADAFPRALAWVDRLAAADPEAALNLLDAVAELEPKNETLTSRRVDLLKASIAAQPERTNRVVELALIYEKTERVKECYELLQPYRDRLGATEGARLLGQHLLTEGHYQDAYDLLYPYVQTRLERLHAIERSHTNIVASTYQAALNHLRLGNAAPSFYTQYNQAPKAQQEELVEKFVQKWMQNDTRYRRAIEQLKTANQIVHVALDLGIVQLNRAQGFDEPAQRKAELEAAEKTFLAIRGLAGETDEFRLFLGQVYYWLGRSAEGKDLFDQLLAARQRSIPILLALGRTLREVGETKQARATLEEAFHGAKAAPQKYAAASLRAVVATDIADKIAWLEKADPAEAATQVALNNARGEQALEQGRKEAAAGYLRKAIASYESMTQSSAILNNTGLAYLSLYEATGRPADLNHGLDLLEQAVALAPGNSILLINTTQILIARACMDVLGDTIRLDLLKEQPDLETFSFLYNNETDRRALHARLRGNETMKKALGCLDRALLLAPKSRQLYREQLQFLAAFEDVPELQKLGQRLHAARLDPAEHVLEAKEAWNGSRDQEFHGKLQTQIRRLEDLQQTSAVRQHAPTLSQSRTSLDTVRPVTRRSIPERRRQPPGKWAHHHCPAGFWRRLTPRAQMATCLLR